MAVVGVQKLFAKLNALGGNAEEVLKKSIDKNLRRIQADAKANAPTGDGQLRNSIHVADAKSNNGSITGSVSTNLQHAPYVEFGTGPVGDRSPKDLPAHIASKISYRQDGWYIHESQIDESTAEKYHFRRIETDAGVFYYTEGQAAQPYLYPAYQANEQRTINSVKYELRKEIKKLEVK